MEFVAGVTNVIIWLYSASKPSCLTEMLTNCVCVRTMSVILSWNLGLAPQHVHGVGAVSMNE